MKLLLLADKESSYLWDYYQPGKLDGIDLILSSGDLKSSYLTFLVTMGKAPLLYVHGNHDGHYDYKPPEGCECIEDRIVNINGLRILGLGGSMRYNGGPYQYTDKEMARRIRKLRLKLLLSGGVDIVVTHAPPRDFGDGDDYAHRGFESFLPFLDKYKPKYLIHGHIHANYGANIPRTVQRGDTTIINAFERHIIEI